MRSEAQKKADKKYIKNNTQRLVIKLFNTTDSDIIDKINKVPNKSGYVKQLIRNDINENQKQSS